MICVLFVNILSLLSDFSLEGYMSLIIMNMIKQSASFTFFLALS